jgi:thiol-disulfide isomerase/thioredoxin
MFTQVLPSLALVTATVAVSSAHAQTTLRVGDAAPPLSIAEWVQGDVSGLESGKVHLVEFWATWCGPCKKSIPHLDSLHDKYAGKGLVVVGVSNEKPETVKPFVQGRGSGMSYPVAVDQNDQTTQAWMKAAGKDGIPCAFLVTRDGKIAWIGHPADPEMDLAIPKLLAGKYDPAAEKKAAPVLAAAERAARQRNYREAYGHFDKVIEIDPKVFSGVVLRRYELMLTGEKDVDAAKAYLADKIATQYVADPITLAEFADALVNDPKYQPRDLALAQAASAAMLATAPDRPESLAVVAMVQFANGEVEEAIENQQQAWMLAPTSEKAEYRRVLDNYRSSAVRRSSITR